MDTLGWEMSIFPEIERQIELYEKVWLNNQPIVEEALYLGSAKDGIR